MKKAFFSLVLIMSVIVSGVYSQDPPVKKIHKFHAGIEYSFFRTSYDLNKIEMSSNWEGTDLGSLSLDKDEIDHLNSRTDNTNDLQAISVNAGMVFLNQLESRWYIDGSLILGLSRIRTEVSYQEPADTFMIVRSSFSNPLAGLSFLFMFRIDSHWGIAAMPQAYYSWGRSDEITDSIRPFTSNFNNNLDEKFRFGYGRINVLAMYSINRFRIGMGPGFYYSFMEKEYSINRVNPEDAKEYNDQINSSLHSNYLIDGCLQADWTFVDYLTLSLNLAAGKDMHFTAGIQYNF